MTDLFARSEWFREARFGMFIHWGPYAVAGRGEWVRSAEELSITEYQPYVDAFVPHTFDANEWAELAHAAGMKYAVLTAKHHDGFALFDTAQSEYGTMHNGLGRDVVAEFVEAFRARGIKVGLYFSLLDWYHPDYPAFGDAFHPQRHDESFRGRPEDFDRYLDFMHAQVRELCSNYGTLDLLWFDFAYDDMRGDRWRASELVEMVRTLQPTVLIDNRLETSADGFGSIVTAEPTAWCGDFVSPEQLIPSDGITNYEGKPVPWESCITLNNHWGFVPDDVSFKPARMVVRKLAETVSKGGNLLINIGPNEHGRVAHQARETLEGVGRWLAQNGQSIYGAGIAEAPKPDWGYYTQRGENLYAHVLEPPIGPLALSGVRPSDITSVAVAGSQRRLADSWLTEAYPDTAFLSFGGGDAAFTYPLPDEIDTVVTIELAADSSADKAESERLAS